MSDEGVSELKTPLDDRRHETILDEATRVLVNGKAEFKLLLVPRDVVDLRFFAIVLVER